MKTLFVRNYLMKYMTKQFGKGEDPWTEGERLFNAMIWATGTRMWGTSKELAEVMRKPVKESDITWDMVELLMPGAQQTVWSRDEGTPFPDLNNEPDPDDLCHECDVIKQFWRNQYVGIERQKNISKLQL